MKPRYLKCLAHFGDPPDGSIDVRESIYIYIVREHLTGSQHYPDNGLVSGTRGEVSHNQEEEVSICIELGNKNNYISKKQKFAGNRYKSARTEQINVTHGTTASTDVITASSSKLGGNNSIQAKDLLKPNKLC
ncbi:hypothetical protein AVEN_200387-1 [Araneus ventricosus]|uniref:Uncharacterized protein n=1 Tax=Araneus ventricosus TaxID=182803 RepID=A0A4Y2SCK6_ARAVE|nr:hypothetical protein AVEN_200387-1 [Araneus ventricosus]